MQISRGSFLNLFTPWLSDPLCSSDSHEFLSYIKANYLTNANDTSLRAIGQAYPDDVTQGSPFDTGVLNAPTPEFKRMAAFQGDLVFQVPRRMMLEQLSDRQNAWTYREYFTIYGFATLKIYAIVNKRLKTTPIMGSVGVFIAHPPMFDLPTHT
jgi:acetylcholinesterase